METNTNMDNKKENLILVFNEDRSKSFRIMIQWERKIFQLYVIDRSDKTNANGWYVSVPKHSIRVFADQHEMDVKDYRGKLKNFLFENQSDDIFYDIVDKEFLMFHNKSKFFSATLEEKSYDEVNEVISKYLEKRFETCPHEPLVIKKAQPPKLLAGYKKEKVKKLQDLKVVGEDATYFSAVRDHKDFYDIMRGNGPSKWGSSDEDEDEDFCPNIVGGRRYVRLVSRPLSRSTLFPPFPFY